MPLTRHEMNEMAAELERALDEMRNREQDTTNAYSTVWRIARKLEEKANRFGPVT